MVDTAHRLKPWKLLKQNNINKNNPEGRKNNQNAELLQNIILKSQISDKNII